MSFLGIDETKISKELIDEFALKIQPILDQAIVQFFQELNKSLDGLTITITKKES